MIPHGNHQRIMKKVKYIIIIISLIIFAGLGTIYYQDYQYTHNYDRTGERK